jgi:hypothetical protein
MTGSSLENTNRRAHMGNKNDFEETFKRLKTILEPYGRELNVASDSSTTYSVETDVVMKNKRRLFFGGVRKGKSYASFHLFPVYACPELRKALSPELKKRMQGKSCFNFKTVDEKLLQELGKLTEAGYQKFSDPRVLEKLTGR